MNYFLHYSNSEPLFIGGHAHGRRIHVPAHFYHYQIPTPRPIEEMCRYDRRGFVHESLLATETYRAQLFVVNGREFRLFVHEFLTPDAAFMLLASTCADVPGLRQRIAELERENRTLKVIIESMLQPQ